MVRNLCSEPVRGGGDCTLDHGHGGHHSTVTYACDGCDKRRRGYPYQCDTYYDDTLRFCFLCVKASA